jgi:hypothetical protein
MDPGHEARDDNRAGGLVITTPPASRDPCPRGFSCRGSAGAECRPKGDGLGWPRPVTRVGGLSAPARGDLCPQGPLFAVPRCRCGSLAASPSAPVPGQRRLSARNGPARTALCQRKWQPSVAESLSGRTFQSLPAAHRSRSSVRRRAPLPAPRRTVDASLDEPGCA